MIVHPRRIARLGQREAAEVPPIRAVDRRDAALDVAAADQQHQHVVHAVAVHALRRRLPCHAAARLDAELVHLDVPVPRRRQALEQRTARAPGSPSCSRRRRSPAAPDRTSARCRRSADCSRGSGSAADAACGGSVRRRARRTRHGGASGSARRRPCRCRAPRSSQLAANAGQSAIGPNSPRISAPRTKANPSAASAASKRLHDVASSVICRTATMRSTGL